MEENNNNQEEIFKRHFGILAEEMRGGFKLLGEQIATVSEDVTLLKEDMDVVKSDIVDIKSDIVGIKSELKIMNGKLDNKVEKEVVDDHEKRIVKLEKLALAK